MNNFNCFNSINTETEESNSDKALTALGVLVLFDDLNKKANTIKELQTENSKLKEENITLKGEKELLKKNLELSEEIRNNSSEKKIIELQEDKRELRYKIQKLEFDLVKQTELNVYLVRLLKEREE